MKEHSINQSNFFLHGWYLNDTSICDQLIEVHKNSKEKITGKITNGSIDTYKKESLDVPLWNNDISAEYYKLLFQTMDLYVEKFSMVNYYSKWGLSEIGNIQYYKPNNAFYAWHTERTMGFGANGSRHLVYMTYLNDVNIGGETEFFHQKVKIKPEKGLTLIWPADWTYTHRGIVAPFEEKFIVTGWFNYLKDEETVCLELRK